MSSSAATESNDVQNPDWRSYEVTQRPGNPPLDTTVVEAPRRRNGNATCLLWAGAPEGFYSSLRKRNRLNRLDRHNRDNYWGYRFDVNLSARADSDWKIKMMKALGSQLEMSPWLVYKAVNELFSIDVPETGHPTEVIGFCLFVHLFNQATEAYENRTQSLHHNSSPGKGAIYYPSDDKQDNDEAFQRVAGNLLASNSTVTIRVLQSILQRLHTNSLPRRQVSHRKPSMAEIIQS